MKIGNVELDYGLSVKKITSDSIVIGVVGELINYSGNIGKGFSYVSIEKLLEEIERSLASEEIKNIFLCINSPGGSAFGIIDISRKIRSSNKNIIGVVGYYSCSAAYWIISACKKIIATTEISYIGNIGVLIEQYLPSEVYFVTNKESYKKAPDMRTEKGKELIQEQLGELYNIFILDVAKNRNITLENAKTKFGDGKAYLAKEALDIGLIDELILDFNINETILKVENKNMALKQEILTICQFS